MRRWLSIAAFSLVLLALPVWAQRHGGGGGGARGGSAMHSSSSSSSFHSSGGFHSSAAVHSSGAFHGGGFSSGSGVHYRTGYPYHYRRGFYGRYGYYPYYGYAGYYPYGYYGWYDDPLAYDSSGDQDSYAAYQSPSYPAQYPEDSSQSLGLQRDVQALSGKIDRLQADVEARNRPKSEEPATALVFRDQHVEEVHNYAIAGGTLWILNDKAAKKIPLAQLDIPATVKMNDDRGVDFQVPGPSLQLMIVR
ncbi:MAG: hypothetical protein WA718_00050 [Terriglobales bacterium]